MSASISNDCDHLPATEMLIEHHLEDVLNNNRQAVTTALQTELRNTLKAKSHRKKAGHTHTHHSVDRTNDEAILAGFSKSTNLHCWEYGIL